MIDIHTHVLPGIDDGAKDWDTCLKMLVKSAECGVQKIIATPHYLPWAPQVSPEEIRRLCGEAEKKLQSKYGISIDIYPGNEIYYSVDVLMHLKEGKVLTLADSKYVLVEFEPMISYQVLCRVARDFQNAGYVPVFAHVERYGCLYNREKLRELRQMGVLFQMNVGAFQGGLFDAESCWAKKCLRDGDIDFLASDMHDLQSRVPLSKDRLIWARKRLNVTYRKALLRENAREILGE